MKNLLTSFVFVISFVISLFANGQANDVMENHLEVLGTLNTVAVHSESLAKEIKKWNDPVKVAEGQRIYMQTRAEVSGAITRYKSAVLNPKLLKTEGNKQQFKDILNSVIKSQNELVKFYDGNYKNFVTASASNFAIEAWMISLVQQIGITLYKEIKQANQEKRERYASEAEANQLKEWSAIGS